MCIPWRIHKRPWSSLKIGTLAEILQIRETRHQQQPNCSEMAENQERRGYFANRQDGELNRSSGLPLAC